MRRPFRHFGLACSSLVAPVAPLHAQGPDHVPLVLLPAVAPRSYPCHGTLAQIHAWLYEEFTRIAETRDEGPLPAPPRYIGGFCRTISVSATSEALPISEWHVLARRATRDLASKNAEIRRTAVSVAATLQQVACCGDPPVRGLVSIELLTALADRVGDSDPKIRGRAAGLIADNRAEDRVGHYLQTPGFDPLPTLLAAINDSDPDVRRQIVHAIQNIGLGVGTTGSDRYGSHADAVVRALLSVADASDRMTRLVAIHAIGYAGVAAMSAMPKLIQWLDSTDDMQRRGAAWALAELGPLAAPAVPKLIEGLRSHDQRDQMSALMALCGLKDAAGPAVPAIAELLSDKDLTITGMATWTLTLIGPAAKGATPQLRDLAARSDGENRREIIKAIDVIEGRRFAEESSPWLPNPN